MNRTQTARRTTALVAVLALLAVAAPASAQDSPVGFNIGVGPMFPNGDIADRFNTGYTIPVGVTWNITPQVGIQFEYHFARMNGPSASIPSTDDQGLPSVVHLDTNHQTNNGTFNFVYRAPTRGVVGGYFLAGPGFYHRSVELTTPDVGFVTVCDPWWLICSIAPVGIDRVIGSRSTTNFGFNVGGGVTFGHFYVEARYHYVRGPEFDVPAGVPTPAGVTQAGKIRANGHYFPINFGVRF